MLCFVCVAKTQIFWLLLNRPHPASRLCLYSLPPRPLGWWWVRVWEGTQLGQLTSTALFACAAFGFPVFISTHELAHLIFFLSCLRGGEREDGWVEVWSQCWLTHHTHSRGVLKIRRGKNKNRRPIFFFPMIFMYSSGDLWRFCKDKVNLWMESGLKDRQRRMMLALLFKYQVTAYVSQLPTLPLLDKTF